MFCLGESCGSLKQILEILIQSGIGHEVCLAEPQGGPWRIISLTVNPNLKQAGHGTLFDSSMANHIVGFTFHSVSSVPIPFRFSLSADTYSVYSFCWRHIMRGAPLTMPIMFVPPSLSSSYIFLTPLYSWLEKKATASIERDENYIPHQREHYDLPSQKEARKADYAEVFEETPLWTLSRVLIMQGLYAIFLDVHSN